MFFLLNIPSEQMERYRAAPVRQVRRSMGFSFEIPWGSWLWLAMHSWEEFLEEEDPEEDGDWPDGWPPEE